MKLQCVIYQFLQKSIIWLCKHFLYKVNEISKLEKGKIQEKFSFSDNPSLNNYFTEYLLRVLLFAKMC